MSFDAVLTAAQADAGWAYERLFCAYSRPVAGYLRGQGAEDPDGMTNEVFLGAFRNLTSFRGDEGQFRKWLFTIARNRVIDERRRRERRPVTEGREHLEGPAAGGADREALARMGTERVHALLDQLAPDQREVLLLRILADLTVEQVASVLGKQPGAVKQLQRRGIAALRRRLSAEDER